MYIEARHTLVNLLSSVIDFFSIHQYVYQVGDRKADSVCSNIQNPGGKPITGKTLTQICQSHIKKKRIHPKVISSLIYRMIINQYCYMKKHKWITNTWISKNMWLQGKMLTFVMIVIIKIIITLVVAVVSFLLYWMSYRAENKTAVSKQINKKCYNYLFIVFIYL